MLSCGRMSKRIAWEVICRLDVREKLHFWDWGTRNRTQLSGQRAGEQSQRLKWAVSSMADATAAEGLPLDADADMDDDLQVFGGEPSASPGAGDAHTGGHRALNNDYLGSISSEVAQLRTLAEIWPCPSARHLPPCFWQAPCATITILCVLNGSSFASWCDCSASHRRG
jgi:hypothetical protein